MMHFIHKKCPSQTATSRFHMVYFMTTAAAAQFISNVKYGHKYAYLSLDITLMIIQFILKAAAATSWRCYNYVY